MSKLVISLSDFKKREIGVKFIEKCVRKSFSFLYKNGNYHFNFCIADNNIVYETQPKDITREFYGIFVDCQTEIEGCNSLEEFETSPEWTLKFTAVCEKLYDKAYEIICEEIKCEERGVCHELL